MSKKEAILVIDYTNDFVHEKGALNCGVPGRKIEHNILQWVDNMFLDGHMVILPTDFHKPSDQFHPENKLFPEHNLDNTWGRELYNDLNHWFINNKNSNQVYFMDKTRYSAFVGTNLDLYLRSRGITSITITGVCTDICVLHTAIDAYNLNYKLKIVKNAVASFNEVGHNWALDHFKKVLNAEIV